MDRQRRLQPRDMAGLCVEYADMHGWAHHGNGWRSKGVGGRFRSTELLTAPRAKALLGVAQEMPLRRVLELYVESLANAIEGLCTTIRWPEDA